MSLCRLSFESFFSPSIPGGLGDSPSRRGQNVRPEGLNQKPMIYLLLFYQDFFQAVLRTPPQFTCPLSTTSRLRKYVVDWKKKEKCKRYIQCCLFIHSTQPQTNQAWNVSTETMKGTAKAIKVGVKANQTRESTSALSRRRARQGPGEGDECRFHASQNNEDHGRGKTTRALPRGD